MSYEPHQDTLEAALQRQYNGFGLQVVIALYVQAEIDAGRLAAVAPKVVLGITATSAATIEATNTTKPKDEPYRRTRWGGSDDKSK